MLPRILRYSRILSEGGVGFEGDKVGEIVVGIDKSREEFFRDNNFIGSRKNLDVLNLEVE